MTVGAADYPLPFTCAVARANIFATQFHPEKSHHAGLQLLANFVAYWLIGLPVGYVLCFKLGWGAVGVWIGLCGGLMIIGSALLLAWHRRRLPA